MVFERKRIQIETLGEYLQEARKSLDLSLEDASEQAKIKAKFLRALEDGRFNALPAEVYVYGFLKQIGQLYRIEPDILVKQFKKEKSIQEHLGEYRQNNGFWKENFFSKIIITPKSASAGLGLIFILLTVGYIIWQVMGINKTPDLEIFEPQDRQTVFGSYVEVKGKTNPGSRVSVNQTDVYVDSGGNFKTQASITPGPKELTVVSSNRFDKKAVKTILVIGQQEPQTQSQGLDLNLRFTGDGTLSFSVDGQAVQNSEFHSGDVKTITAKEKIVLSTSDAGKTKATLNGKDLGFLGRPGEALENIPFLAESGNIDK